MLNKYHLQMEMVSGFYVLAMTSIMDRMEGFERLYEASYELTEKLRNRVIDNCDELYNAVERLYTDLIAKIKEID